MKKYAVHLYIMLLLLVWMLLSYGKELSEVIIENKYSYKKPITEEESDEDKAQKYIDEILPYIPMEIDYRIGSDFEDYKDAPTEWLVSLDGTGWSEGYYLVDNNEICYYGDGNRDYFLGVKDGTIIAIIEPVNHIGTEMTYIKDYLYLDGSELCPPYEIGLRQGVSYFFWKINGGYLGVLALDPYMDTDASEDYLWNSPQQVVYISDAKYFSLLRTLVELDLGVSFARIEIHEAVDTVYNAMVTMREGEGNETFRYEDLCTVVDNWGYLMENPVKNQPEDCIISDNATVLIYSDMTLVWYREDYKYEFLNKKITTDELSQLGIGTFNAEEYYTNSQGDLVDKVEEFREQTYGEYVVKYPILENGIDEVVVYEFDTYDNKHICLDATNIYQQTRLDEIGDYGDVSLYQIAPGKDINYMYDGESYYIEDYTRNLLTISEDVCGLFGDVNPKEVLGEDVYWAVIDTYGWVQNYSSENEGYCDFVDKDNLRIIADNYEEIKSLNLYEAPIAVEEYIAMRSGPMIRFDYNTGVSVYWTLETDEVEIALTN